MTEAFAPKVGDPRGVLHATSPLSDHPWWASSTGRPAAPSAAGHTRTRTSPAPVPRSTIMWSR